MINITYKKADFAAVKKLCALKGFDPLTSEISIYTVHQATGFIIH